jgi:hypothetical protein
LQNSKNAAQKVIFPAIFHQKAKTAYFSRLQKMSNNREL